MRTLIFWTLVLMTHCASVWAEESQPDLSVGEAITQGHLFLNLRPRYEHVEQDGKPKNADAYTLRTLLGWRTGQWHGLGVYVEGINVGHLGEEHYSDDPARVSPYPLVADPDSTDVNQLYADYTASRRQRCVRDVNPSSSTTCATSVTSNSGKSCKCSTRLPSKTRACRIRAVCGLSDAAKDGVRHAARYQRADLQCALYVEAQQCPRRFRLLARSSEHRSSHRLRDNSNKIVGLRADGKYPIREPWSLLYTAEYAKQDHYSGGDPRIDADYYHLALGVQWKDFFVRLEQERLASNDGVYGFQTPLGTNHLFQGWADLFLTTPRQGIRDSYVSAGAKLYKATLYGEYHRFRSDFGDFDFGKNWISAFPIRYSNRWSAKSNTRTTGRAMPSPAKPILARSGSR